MSEEESAEGAEYWNALLAELGVVHEPNPVRGGFVAVELGTGDQDESPAYESYDKYPIDSDQDGDIFLARSEGPAPIMPFFDHEPQRPEFPSPPELDLKAMSALKKYVPSSAEKIWESNLDLYESIANDMVFERLDDDFPIRPMGGDTRATETPEKQQDVIEVSGSVSSMPRTPSRDLDIIDRHVVDVTQAIESLPQPRLASRLSSSVVNGAQVSGSMAVAALSGASQKLTLVAKLALVHFSQYLQTNGYVSTMLNTVNETSATIQDQAEVVQRALSLGLQGSSEEAKHLENIRCSEGWQCVFWRYLLGTVTWQQRQMIEETNDAHAGDDIFIKKQLKLKLKLAHNFPGDEAEFYKILTQQGDAEEGNKRVLTEHFTAPKPIVAAACWRCARSFSLTLHRHHCANCGNSVCDADSRKRRQIFHFGIVEEARVCDVCAKVIDDRYLLDDLVWKDRRVEAFEQGRLLPYRYPKQDDSLVTSIKECSLLMARNALNLASPTRVLYETADMLKRVGLTSFAGMLLQQEFIESIETLKKITGMDQMFEVTLHELTACICHNLAANRGIRGCVPDIEARSHRNTRAQFSPAAMDLLPHLGMDAVRAAVEQMESRNNEEHPGTVYCTPASDPDISLVIKYAPLALNVIYENEAVDEQRLGALQDLKLLYASAATNRSFKVFQQRYSLFVTDVSNLKKMERRIPIKEAVLVLRSDISLEDLATLLKEPPVSFPPSPMDVFNCVRGLSDNNITGDSSEESVNERLHDPRFYPCDGLVNEKLLDITLAIMREVCPSLNKLYLSGFRVTIVGHSTAGAIASLMSYLLAPFFDSLVYSISYGSPCCVDAQTSVMMKPFHLSVILHDDVVPRLNKQTLTKLLRDVVAFRSTVFRHKDQDWRGVLVRSMQSRVHRSHHGPIADLTKEEEEEDQAEKLSEVMDSFYGNSSNGSNGSQSGASSSVAAAQMRTLHEADAVMVEAEACPEIFVPGKVLHIYFYRGQYMCSEVSCTFGELRVINIQTHMFSDHSNANLLNALLEVRAARKTTSSPPEWVPYHATNRCQTCHNSFTWHSTFKGHLQEYRERYNCRHCGALVCGPCSMQRRSIPKFGMVFPRRICDRCVLNGDFSF